MKVLANLIILIFLSIVPMVAAQGQNIGYERDRHRLMLRNILDDVQENYYDSTLKGVDAEAKFTAANERLKQAASIGQMSGIIAQFLLDFDDSHLFFLPPGKASKTDYGFEMRMLGDKCVVVSLDEKSDAAKKGLAVGDELIAIEGFGPLRENLWKIGYSVNTLWPRPTLKLRTLKPDGTQAEIEIGAKVTQGKKILDATGADRGQILRDEEEAYYKSVKQYFYDKTPGLLIWKMPRFSLEPAKVDEIMNRARKGDLILDLRGNGGGRVDMVLRLIGNFFPSDLKVGDEKTRKDVKEVIAKSRKNETFDGKLVVLIDSGSASASEIFARVIQLEKRGSVLGDVSAGAVMESRYFGHKTGIDVIAFYGASITVADLIMKDGKSLEKVGVSPDERLVPSAKDIAAGRDIALARALELLGQKMTAEEAGKIFPNVYEGR